MKGKILLESHGNKKFVTIVENQDICFLKPF